MGKDPNLKSLAQAASDLVLILHRLEDTDDIDLSLTDIFRSAINTEGKLVVNAVDRRWHFLQRTDLDIAHCDMQIDRWKATRKRLSNIKERLEVHTESLMGAFPEVEFKGNDGHFKIVNNGGAQKLTFTVLTAERTYRHCVDLDNGESPKIPLRFLTHFTGVSIDTIAVRQAIDAGEKLDFARLEPRGERLVY